MKLKELDILEGKVADLLDKYSTLKREIEEYRQGARFLELEETVSSLKRENELLKKDCDNLKSEMKTGLEKVLFKLESIET